MYALISYYMEWKRSKTLYIVKIYETVPKSYPKR